MELTIIHEVVDIFAEQFKKHINDDSVMLTFLKIITIWWLFFQLED